MTWQFGVMGAAWAALAVYALGLPVSLAVAERVRRGVFLEVGRTVLATAVSCAAIVVVVWPLRDVLRESSTLMRTLACVPAGVAAYAACTWFFNRRFFADLVASLRTLRKA